MRERFERAMASEGHRAAMELVPPAPVGDYVIRIAVPAGFAALMLWATVMSVQLGAFALVPGIACAGAIAIAVLGVRFARVPVERRLAIVEYVRTVVERGKHTVVRHHVALRLRDGDVAEYLADGEVAAAHDLGVAFTKRHRLLAFVKLTEGS